MTIIIIGVLIISFIAYLYFAGNIGYWIARRDKYMAFMFALAATFAMAGTFLCLMLL